VAIGVSADELSAQSVIPGVTRDATSGIYYPANTTEMATFAAAIGYPAGAPNGLWNFQDAATSTFADSINGMTLTAGTAPMYRSPVVGASRLCYRGIDGNATASGRNVGGSPSANLVSTLQMADCDFPASPPGTNRDVMGVDTNAFVQLTTAGKLRLSNGATTDTANVYTGKHPIILQINLTATTATLYTDLEVITTTFAAPAALSFIGFGIVGALQGNIGYLWGTEFSVAPAERTLAQIRTFLQGRGYSIPW
jgi:hypothetical protein